METCLIIGKVWPEPSSTAAGRRTLDIVEALNPICRRVVFASAAQKNEHCANLSAWGVEEQNIKLNDSSFNEWIKGLNPDVVIFDRFMTEEQFGWRVERSVPSAIRILDTSDLHLLREARRLNIDTCHEIDLFNEIALREIGSIFRSDLTLLISEAEMKILKETFDIEAPLVEYWPFSTKMNHFTDEPLYQERQNCVMLGSFMHPPNVDSVRWCVSEIWPQIREQLPDVELHIYGSYSDDFRLSEKILNQGVFLKGRMGDVSKDLPKYRLNLAPLRYGAGLKGKVLDGLRLGTPTIGTEIAYEGFDATLDRVIAKDAEEFASKTVSLYWDPEQWDCVQKIGYDCLKKRFDQDDWHARFKSILEETSADLEARRRSNFIGKMLRHHSHRSTEFMSRWIELKNAQ